MAGANTTSVYERGGGRARADEAPAALEGTAADESRAHQEALLDEGVQETFPASDPVSVARIL